MSSFFAVAEKLYVTHTNHAFQASSPKTSRPSFGAAFFLTQLANGTSASKDGCSRKGHKRLDESSAGEGGMTQTRRMTLVATLYMVIGIISIALGISGGSTPATNVALGGWFVLIGAIRFVQLFRQR